MGPLEAKLQRICGFLFWAFHKVYGIDQFRTVYKVYGIDQFRIVSEKCTELSEIELLHEFERISALINVRWPSWSHATKLRPQYWADRGDFDGSLAAFALDALDGLAGAS